MVASIPKKKRVEKDTRLKLKCGAIITKDNFVAAVKQRAEKNLKKKTLNKKKVKKSPKVVEMRQR